MTANAHVVSPRFFHRDIYSQASQGALIVQAVAHSILSLRQFQNILEREVIYHDH